MTSTLWKSLGTFALLLFVVAAPLRAQAGVAIDNAVMLDPYDPVPPIQFHHWYGGEDGWHHHHDRHWVSYRCQGDCRDGCEDRCEHGCDRDCGRHDACDRDCGGCDRGCERRDSSCDRDCAPPPMPCGSSCYDAVRWEHRWRAGDRMGQEWYDSGKRERERSGAEHGHRWYGHENDSDWRDEDGDSDSPPPHR